MSDESSIFKPGNGLKSCPPEVLPKGRIITGVTPLASAFRPVFGT